MKSLIFLLLISIFACGKPGEQSYVIPEEYKIPADTVPILSAPLKLQPFTVTPPEVGNVSCPRYTMNIKLTVVGDSIVAFNVSTNCAENIQAQKAVSNVCQDCNQIQKGDTKISIARRLGVPVRKVLNREPLQIGDKIIVDAN